MGEVYVIGRRPRIAGWMIVDKDDRRSAEFEGAAHDLPGVNRRMIDRADALNLVGDQMILLVENISARSRRADFVGKREAMPRLRRDCPHRARTAKRGTKRENTCK